MHTACAQKISTRFYGEITHDRLFYAEILGNWTRAGNINVSWIDATYLSRNIYRARNIYDEIKRSGTQHLAAGFNQIYAT